METTPERVATTLATDDGAPRLSRPAGPPWALCHAPGDESLDGSVYAAFRLDPETLDGIAASIGRFEAAKAAFPDMTYAAVFDCTPEWFEVGATARVDYDDPIDAARYAALIRAQDDGEGDPRLVEILARLGREGGWEVVPDEFLPAWGNMRTELNLRRFTQITGSGEAPTVEWSCCVKHTNIRCATARFTPARLAELRAACPGS